MYLSCMVGIDTDTGGIMWRLCLLWLISQVCAKSHQEIVYVTDVPIFSQLPLCVADAVEVAVGNQDCDWRPAAKFQKCICHKKLEGVAHAVSVEISRSCSTSSYQDSASIVLDAYCHQDATITFPPLPYTVSSYISELPPYSDLAVCEQSILGELIYSAARMGPRDPAHLAKYICENTESSSYIGSQLRSGQYCFHNSEGPAPAADLFDAYCAMNTGVTSLPTQSPIPGDMSYFITDLFQYKSLDECARSAIDEAVMFQTFQFCPNNGPQALASCMCFKEPMTENASWRITRAAGELCLSNSVGSIAAAVSVFDYYCSAARAQVTEVLDVPVWTPTQRSSSTGPTETSATASPESESHGPSTGTIVGATILSVAGALGLGFGVFCVMRRRRSAVRKANPVTEHSLENITPTARSSKTLCDGDRPRENTDDRTAREAT